ncbi:MAG: metallophosphoesterase [Lachnospiraceae bacterium]|nr:metallophosphoesterase [Lachnospiraceae bacterium]
MNGQGNVDLGKTLRILIVSDTHGNLKYYKKALEQASPIDFLIHAGDVEGQEDTIQELAACPAAIVSGNNDFFSSLEREEEFTIGKYHILLTHGHYYYVSMGAEHLAEEAVARNVDIAIYGHTHRPSVERIDGVTLVNPGSLTYPRQEGRRPSFILMEIDRFGEAHFTIEYL